MASWFEKIAALPQMLKGWLSGNISVNMLVTGKTGVGKSTLINAVIGKDVAKEGRDAPGRGTVTVQLFDFKHNDVDFTIWESSGLQDGLDKEEEYIRDMCANSDLVLYCAKMTNTQFRKEDHDAIRKLTLGLGKDIWENAIFVMTFANKVHARRRRGRKLTPDEERQRNCAFFKQRIEYWKAQLVIAVIEAGVDAKIAANIPIIPAGYNEEMELPDCDNWLSSLLDMSFQKVKERSRPALLKANLHGMSYPQIIPDGLIDKPLLKYPAFYNMFEASEEKQHENRTHEEPRKQLQAPCMKEKGIEEKMHQTEEEAKRAKEEHKKAKQEIEEKMRWTEKEAEEEHKRCGILSIQDLSKVLNRIWDVRVHWYNLGLGLNIDSNSLDAIESGNQGKPDRCLREMLSEWLKKTSRPTWSALAVSLKSPSVGYSHLADEILSENPHTE